MYWKLNIIILIHTWLKTASVYAADSHIEDNFKADIQYQFNQLLERVKFLENGHDVQQKRIKTLEAKLANQKADLDVFKTNLVEKDRLHAKLRRRFSGRYVSLRELKQSQRNIDFVEDVTVNRMKRSESEITVAFTAGLSHMLEHLGTDQNVVFDRVETNIGNGYNPHHGVFTAPITGTYVFSSTILSAGTRFSQCYITVNGAHKAGVHASANVLDNGSQLLVVRLNQGDDVSVQNRYSDTQVFGNTDIWSTFSGFLLRPDVSDAVVG